MQHRSEGPGGLFLFLLTHRHLRNKITVYFYHWQFPFLRYEIILAEVVALTKIIHIISAWKHYAQVFYLHRLLATSFTHSRKKILYNII